MRIISSLQGICDIARPSQGLHDMKNAGFQSLFLDFSIICPTWELEICVCTGQKKQWKSRNYCRSRQTGFLHRRKKAVLTCQSPAHHIFHGIQSVPI